MKIEEKFSKLKQLELNHSQQRVRENESEEKFNCDLERRGSRLPLCLSVRQA